MARLVTPLPELIIYVDGRSYLLAVDEVQEALEIDCWTPLPCAIPPLVGAIARHGRVIPLIELGNQGAFQRPFAIVLAGESRRLAVLADSLGGISGFAPPEMTPEYRHLSEALRKLLELPSPDKMEVIQAPPDARRLSLALLSEQVRRRPITGARRLGATKG